MLLRNAAAVLVGLVLALPAMSATWAESMFDELACDFGTVPRGPTLSHHYRLKNNTGKSVTIGNVRVSCGCTAASASKSSLNPGEETTIQAQMDTSRFSGPRTVTIFVRFDAPQYEEVRLSITANTRDDLTITPETLDLGQVKPGENSPKSTRILLPAGRQDKIVEVTSDSNFVQPAVKEVKRTDGYVEYEVTAKLRSDTPAGKWYTTIWLKTNSASIPKTSVPLIIEVKP
jgi:hypothetical protein